MGRRHKRDHCIIPINTGEGVVDDKKISASNSGEPDDNERFRRLLH